MLNTHLANDHSIGLATTSFLQDNILVQLFFLNLLLNFSIGSLELVHQFLLFRIILALGNLLLQLDFIVFAFLMVAADLRIQLFFDLDVNSFQLLLFLHFKLSLLNFKIVALLFVQLTIELQWLTTKSSGQLNNFSNFFADCLRDQTCLSRDTLLSVHLSFMLVNFDFQEVNLHIEVLDFLADLLDSAFKVLLLSGFQELHQVSLLLLFVVLEGGFSRLKSFTHFFEDSFLLLPILSFLDSIHVFVSHLLKARVFLLINFLNSNPHFILTLFLHAAGVNASFNHIVLLNFEVFDLLVKIANLSHCVTHILLSRLDNLLVQFLSHRKLCLKTVGLVLLFLEHFALKALHLLIVSVHNQISIFF